MTYRRTHGDLFNIARHNRFRYASEFFALLFDRKRKVVLRNEFIAALEDVQDHIGAQNDLATTPHVLERVGIEDDLEAPPLLAGGKKALLKAAAETHGELIDASRYWRSRSAQA